MWISRDKYELMQYYAEEQKDEYKHLHFKIKEMESEIKRITERKRNSEDTVSLLEDNIPKAKNEGFKVFRIYYDRGSVDAIAGDIEKLTKEIETNHFLTIPVVEGLFSNEPIGRTYMNVVNPVGTWWSRRPHIGDQEMNNNQKYRVKSCSILTEEITSVEEVWNLEIRNSFLKGFYEDI